MSLNASPVLGNDFDICHIDNMRYVATYDIKYVCTNAMSYLPIPIMRVYVWQAIIKCLFKEVVLWYVLKTQLPLTKVIIPTVYLIFSPNLIFAIILGY